MFRTPVGSLRDRAVALGIGYFLDEACRKAGRGSNPLTDAAYSPPVVLGLMAKDGAYFVLKTEARSTLRCMRRRLFLKPRWVCSSAAERLTVNQTCGGSSPPGPVWALSSVGRAPALQAGGRRFKSGRVHWKDGRAADCTRLLTGEGRPSGVRIPLLPLSPRGGTGTHGDLKSRCLRAYRFESCRGHVGKVAERINALVLKTSRAYGPRGFESHPSR